MILPSPVGWEKVAREVGAEVADGLGDVAFVIELWTSGSGAPAPSMLYDENALLATGALIVNAARAGLAVRDGDPALGGPLRAIDRLESELANILRRSIEEAPRGCRRLLSMRTETRPSRAIGVNDSSEMAATIACVARAAARVLLKPGASP